MRKRSNKNQNQKPIYEGSDSDPERLTEVIVPRETPQERQKRMDMVRAIIRSKMGTDEEQKKYDEQVAKLEKRIKQWKAQEAEQRRIKNLYPSFKHLPTDVLAFAEKLIKQLDKHPQCQMEQNTKIPKSIKSEKIQSHRNQRLQKRLILTKPIILAQLELKISGRPWYEIEADLCQNEYSIIESSYSIARQIEDLIFVKLYEKPKQERRRPYDNQIDLVTFPLCDKNDIEFKRKIVNRQYPIIELVTATQESLMCEKTKQEKFEEMKRFVRQNTVQEQYAYKLCQKLRQQNARTCESIESVDIAEEREAERQQRKEEQVDVREEQPQMKEEEKSCEEESSEEEGQIRQKESSRKSKPICKKTHETAKTINERPKHTKAKNFDV